MVVLVVISGNELILGMSLIKILKRIGPSIDPWGTQMIVCCRMFYDLKMPIVTRGNILSTIVTSNFNEYFNNWIVMC